METTLYTLLMCLMSGTLMPIHLHPCILACLAFVSTPNSSHCGFLLFHYASVNPYRKGILNSNFIVILCKAHCFHFVQGGSGYTELRLIIMSTVCCLKCEGLASYINPCYLTTRRIPNQVNIYLYGFFLTFCYKPYTFVLVRLFTFSPKIILECEKCSIFTAQLWILEKVLFG
ncbi:hypothetical protein F7725_011872 [Dissostichus mawsoni]|uniref:Uncharacterized protein n=1 Tax=Dissostichus mawsoni TaxID=36200 RepID=A0A7J5ZC15_DISMA|nr:hypothetical protein F7725_011872 [Dissostichus mawsoni]